MSTLTFYEICWSVHVPYDAPEDLDKSKQDNSSFLSLDEISANSLSQEMSQA